jgi:hypothetical protein
MMFREMKSGEMMFRKIIAARGRVLPQIPQDGFAARTVLYAMARRDLVRLAVFS